MTMFDCVLVRSSLCRCPSAVTIPRSVRRLGAAAVVILATSGFAAELAADDGDLPPPKSLWAAQTSPTSITLVWNSVPGATGYRISVSGKVERAGANTLRWVVPISSRMFGQPFRASIQTVDASGLAS